MGDLSMQGESVFVGVDASKAELVSSVHGGQGCATLPNQDAAVAAWLRTLPKEAKVAVESTGECHLTLVRQAVRLGVTVYVLNARDVYFYAKALGMRAKTDRVDARVIARYLAEHHAQLRPYQPPSPVQAEIEQLLAQRWVAVTKRTALRQALRGNPAIEQQIQHLEASFDSLLQAIDQRIAQLIDADPGLKASQGLTAEHHRCGLASQCAAEQPFGAAAVRQRRCLGRLQRLGSSAPRFGSLPRQATAVQAWLA
jgi:transposase